MSDDFRKYSTAAVHGDGNIREPGDVAPAIHPTTNYEYGTDPSKLFPTGTQPEDGRHTYSRESQNNVDRIEAVLDELLDGPSTVYSSGLSAFHGLMTLLNPKRLFIGEGYNGIHCVAQIFQRAGLEIFSLSDIDAKCGKGDFVHLETPVNPTGLALDVELYAQKAHSKGAYLVVDSTFAPPPLFHPFKHGADFILHSASKYLSGHSDVLAGVIVSRDEATKKQLVKDRMMLGSIIQPFEAWLLLRSLKTYPIRLQVQSENVNRIVAFLSENLSQLPKLTKVYSANLQTEAFVKKQHPLGGSPTFTIEVTDEDTAKSLPGKLKLYYHTTSLGSVHSYVEWRPLSNANDSPNLLRISVGIERAEDLIDDLVQALK